MAHRHLCALYPGGRGCYPGGELEISVLALTIITDFDFLGSSCSAEGANLWLLDSVRRCSSSVAEISIAAFRVMYTAGHVLCLAAVAGTGDGGEGEYSSTCCMWGRHVLVSSLIIFS